MRARLLAIATILVVCTPAPAMASDVCAGEGELDAILLHCHQETPSANAAGSLVVDDRTSPSQYLWISSCPQARPGGSGDVDCRQAHRCGSPQLVVMSLYAQEIRDGIAVSGWTFIRSECRDPAAPRDQPRSLTEADVLEAIRRIGLPANQVNGPAYTLVNLDTTFSTTPTPLNRTLTIIGCTVTVDAQPTTYTWHWGDDTTTTTTTPGRPYPHTDITHTYTHATDQHQPRQLTITTRYHARYRVDDRPWTDIEDPITITGPTHQLPVKQAAAVLVQP